MLGENLLIGGIVIKFGKLKPVINWAKWRIQSSILKIGRSNRRIIWAAHQLLGYAGRLKEPT
jgi:hypothetical protein